MFLFKQEYEAPLTTKKRKNKVQKFQRRENKLKEQYDFSPVCLIFVKINY